jgi:hypothetical protein
MCDSYLLVCVVVAAVGCTRRAALNSTLFGVRAYNELLVPVIPSRLSPVPDLTFDYCVVPVSQSVSSRSSPALTTPPSQRTAPFPSVNTSTVLARSGYSHISLVRSVTASLPAHRVISGARCPILPGVIVIGNQVGGRGRGEGGRVLSTVVINLPSFGCLAAASTVRAWVALLSITSIIRDRDIGLVFRRRAARPTRCASGSRFIKARHFVTVYRVVVRSVGLDRAP